VVPHDGGLTINGTWHVPIVLALDFSEGRCGVSVTILACCVSYLNAIKLERILRLRFFVVIMGLQLSTSGIPYREKRRSFNARTIIVRQRLGHVVGSLESVWDVAKKLGVRLYMIPYGTVIVFWAQTSI
jgi:hypothetical protein